MTTSTLTDPTHNPGIVIHPVTDTPLDQLPTETLYAYLEDACDHDEYDVAADIETIIRDREVSPLVASDFDTEDVAF